MTIYELAIHDPQGGALLSWHTSRDKAERSGKQAVEYDDADRFQVFRHTIPNTRAGMLKWLNTYYTTDNG